MILWWGLALILGVIGVFSVSPTWVIVGALVASLGAIRAANRNHPYWAFVLMFTACVIFFGMGAAVLTTIAVIS